MPRDGDYLGKPFDINPAPAHIAGFGYWSGRKYSHTLSIGNAHAFWHWPCMALTMPYFMPDQ